MKKLMIAVAMTIALPAAALAQATPAPATTAHAGHNMQGKQMQNCKDMQTAMASGHAGHQMSGAAGQMDHSKMDHSKMAAAHGCSDAAKTGAKQAPSDPHAGHKQ
jgi:hypothetical protein